MKQTKNTVGNTTSSFGIAFSQFIKFTIILLQLIELIHHTWLTKPSHETFKPTSQTRIKLTSNAFLRKLNNRKHKQYKEMAKRKDTKKPSSLSPLVRLQSYINVRPLMTKTLCFEIPLEWPFIPLNIFLSSWFSVKTRTQWIPSLLRIPAKTE